MDGFQQRTKTFSTSSIQNRLGGRKLGDGRYKKDKLLEVHRMNVVYDGTDKAFHTIEHLLRCALALSRLALLAGNRKVACTQPSPHV